MKPVVLSLIAIFLPLAAVAEPQDGIVAAYEAFATAHDPDLAARAQGISPERWGDVTPAGVAARANEAQDLLDRMDVAGAGDHTNHAILRRLLGDHILANAFDTARIPFTGDWGFQAEPLFAALSLRLRSEADARAWIARLNDVPRYFEENRTNMRRGMATGWTAHADPLATMRAQVEAQIMTDPTQSDLFRPFTSLPDTIPPEIAADLRLRGMEATANAIAAYVRLARFIDETYAIAARPGAGIAGLPGADAVYAEAIAHHTAGAGYSVDEIHAIGQGEVARIRSEMNAIISELGFAGSFGDFQAYLRSDPQFYAATDADLMTAAREISQRLDEILPVYFNRLPALGYTVDPVPLSIAPGYTTGRYVQGDPVEARKGSYLVNTFALDQRPLYELPALSAHEAVPGHHLQIALAQEMADQPRFRQDYYATAFGEGWGLYAERIAGEAGIYRTPYERFGALSYEMWRACRLVADTGLHAYGWTRAEAEACFKDNTALAPLNIQTEVTRYIGWPGQATAYKIGELKIVALRAEAEAALGDRFDIRAFHDVVLGQGAVPLDVLDAQVRTWISSLPKP